MLQLGVEIARKLNSCYCVCLQVFQITFFYSWNNIKGKFNGIFNSYSKYRKYVISIKASCVYCQHALIFEYTGQQFL